MATVSRAADVSEVLYAADGSMTGVSMVALHLADAVGGSLLLGFISARHPSIDAANVCSPDTSKNASKPDGCGEFLRVFSMCRENFLVKTGIEPTA